MNVTAHSYITLPFHVEGSDMFLIILVLIWFSLNFLINSVKKHAGFFLQVYLGEADHQVQVIPM